MTDFTSAEVRELIESLIDYIGTNMYSRQLEALNEFANHLETTENWLPTPENVNRLPELIRRYIADLEIQCDPAGQVAELTLNKDQLRRLVRELDVIWNGEARAAKQASLCDMVSQIRNELPALSHSAKSAAEIPDGWQLVPKEPTEEMLRGADASDREYTDRNFGVAHSLVGQGAYDHYIAMLEAAPSLPIATDKEIHEHGKS